jgi:hypothetical protein
MGELNLSSNIKKIQHHGNLTQSADTHIHKSRNESLAKLQEALGHRVLGVGQLRRREHLHDLAGDEEAHQVGDALDLLDAVGHRHRREPPRLLQPQDRLLDVLRGYRVQRARRLIKQKHLQR